MQVLSERHGLQGRTSEMTSRGKSEKTSNGDDFEVLEARDAAAKEAENMIRAIQKYIQQGSNGRQLAIGGVSGWYIKTELLLSSLLACSQ